MLNLRILADKTDKDLILSIFEDFGILNPNCFFRSTNFVMIPHRLERSILPDSVKEEIVEDPTREICVRYELFSFFPCQFFGNLLIRLISVSSIVLVSFGRDAAFFTCFDSTIEIRFDVSSQVIDVKVRHKGDDCVEIVLGTFDITIKKVIKEVGGPLCIFGIFVPCGHCLSIPKYSKSPRYFAVASIQQGAHCTRDKVITPLAFNSNWELLPTMDSNISKSNAICEQYVIVANEAESIASSAISTDKPLHKLERLLSVTVNTGIPVYSLVHVEDEIWLGCEDGNIIVVSYGSTVISRRVLFLNLRQKMVKVVACWHAHDNRVYALALARGRVWSGSLDGTVKVWSEKVCNRIII